MNENIRAFLEKLVNSEELQARFQGINDPDEAYRVASEIQSGFTKEEFVTEMTRIRESLEEDLTDEDLAKSAGGVGTGNVVSTVIGTALTSAAVSSTAVISVFGAATAI